jgi:YHS domain-containing protein
MKYLLLAVLAVFLVHCGKPAHANNGDDLSVTPQVAANEASAPTAFDKQPAVGTKAKCLVMQNEFTVNKATTFSQYKGKHYAFCCPGCKPKFEADPEKYLKNAG